MSKVVGAVNFGSKSFYITGSGIAEGDYAFNHNLQMWKSEKSQFDATLGCMITYWDLKSPGEEPKTQFYSMGRNAHKSFTVDPDSDGKKLIAVSGGATPNLYKETDWDLYLDSLYACGLPEGTFMDDISVLDGIHVHVHPVAESQGRQDMKKKAQSTSEAEIKATGPKMIGIVTEIIAKPWEGEGGIPKGKGGKKSSAAATPSKKKEESGDEELGDIAVDALGKVVSMKDFKEGGKKVKVRIEALKIVEKKHGEDVATKVSDSIFDDDKAYRRALEEIGYTIQGSDVVVQ